MAENLGFGPRAPFGLAIVCFAACFVVVTLTWSENYGNQVSKFNFLHSMAKSRLFSHIMLKSTILHSKWALLKSFCFFLILLRSITNLTHDFKSPFLDIEITIESQTRQHHFGWKIIQSAKSQKVISFSHFCNTNPILNLFN